MIKELTIEHIVHRESPRVFLRFENDTEAIGLVRAHFQAKWSATQRAWHIGYQEGIFEKICELFFRFDVQIFKKNDFSIYEPELKKTFQKNNSSEKELLNEEASEKLKAFEVWMKTRRYSDSTIHTYTDGLKVFLRFFNEKALSELKNEDLLKFNNDYIIANKLSASYQNQIINGVKLFFRIMEHKNMCPELIYRPKSPKLLPNVLSKEEVKQILQTPTNLKHRAMLSLIYSCGLRCGELLRLKISDVDSKRGVVVIKQSKGRKDRIAPLGTKIIELLRDYYKAYNPKHYLFEGQQEGMAYDERSLQNVIKQAVHKANIKKPVSLHWLRHSYATHLLESGTDLRYIQEILGHSSSRTTEIYTHVSTKSIRNVGSPFDNL